MPEDAERRVWVDPAKLRDWMDRGNFEADDFNVDFKTIKSWLNGTHQAGRKKLQSVATELGCSVDDLTQVPSSPAEPSEFDSNTLAEKFRAMPAYGRAPCCAFVAGDISVLTTNIAFLRTIPAYVHVGIEHSTESIYEAYAPAGVRNPPEGAWRKDDDQSSFVRSTFDTLLERSESKKYASRAAFVRDVFRERFEKYRGTYKVVVAFEAPANSGIYEEAALSVALGKALVQLCGPPAAENAAPAGEEAQLSLAAILLSAWYNDVSWATTFACAREEPHDDHLQFLAFDRSDDKKGVSLLELSRDARLSEPESRSQFKDNLGSAPRKPEEVELRGRFTIWLPRSGRSETMASTRWEGSERAEAFARAPFRYIAEQFQAALKDLVRPDERRIGQLMKAHQLLLEITGFVAVPLQNAVASVNGVPGVLGAKLTGSSGSRALIVLSATSANHLDLTQRLNKLDYFSLDMMRQELIV